MKRIFRFWKVVLFDAVGVGLMILALLTGWLPGPGGIPLFIIGLSILAIHHDWARKYIDMIKTYAEKFGDWFFTSNKKIQLMYDILGPVMLLAAGYFAYTYSALWQITPIIVLAVGGITLLLGNRNRWKRIKQRFTKQA